MEKKEIKHTPLPWVQNGLNGIHNEKGNCIATTDVNINLENRTYEMAKDLAKANAEFIVRACNAHAELVGALKSCKEYFISKGDFLSQGEEMIEMIKQALAKAEGKA